MGHVVDGEGMDVKDGAEIRSDGLSEAAETVARNLRRPSLAPVQVTCAALCLEVPLLALAFWFAQYAATSDASFSPADAALSASVGACVAAILIAIAGGYTIPILSGIPVSLSRAAIGLAAPVLVGCVILPSTSPLWLALAASTALAAIVIPSRVAGAIATRWIVETGLTERRAVIAGGGEHATALIRGLARMPGTGIRLCGIFDDRDDIRSPIQVLGIPKIGGYDDLVSFARMSEIDMVIISLPLEAERRIDWLLDLFRVLPVEVRLSAFSRDYGFARPDRDPLISAIRRSFAPERRLTKRTFDLVVAAIAIVALAPIMLAAAAAIRLETPGPILFRQKRHGYNDRIIEVLKFRSMHARDADPIARRVVTRDDPRVTRVGRFLRRSSIDELPQLFNVLRGDLSLVGPRPHAVDALSSRQERFNQIIDGYSARHRLPPGITGWAQVNGWRGEIDDAAKLRARFEHDLFYIENWSIWFDLRIMLRTPLSLLDPTGAY
ncbi:MAG: exopolysaccharide biosynthesis polyprenyl glycosylphosphotransferase [Jannaschia sp.]